MSTTPVCHSALRLLAQRSRASRILNERRSVAAQLRRLHVNRTINISMAREMVANAARVLYYFSPEKYTPVFSICHRAAVVVVVVDCTRTRVLGAVIGNGPARACAIACGDSSRVCNIINAISDRSPRSSERVCVCFCVFLGRRAQHTQQRTTHTSKHQRQTLATIRLRTAALAACCVRELEISSIDWAYPCVCAYTGDTLQTSPHTQRARTTPQ